MICTGATSPRTHQFLLYLTPRQSIFLAINALWTSRIIRGRFYPPSKMGEWQPLLFVQTGWWLWSHGFVLCSPHFPCGQPSFCLPALFPYLRNGDNGSALPPALRGCRAPKFISVTRRVPGSQTCCLSLDLAPGEVRHCPVENTGFYCCNWPFSASSRASEAVVVGDGESRLSLEKPSR